MLSKHPFWQAKDLSLPDRSNEAGANKFFESDVKPYLDNELISWIGPIDDAAKQAFLGKAEGTVVSIRWDEPFGIVIGESLACGTPVIATRRASTPDVIKSGETGVLCPSQEPDPFEFSKRSHVYHLSIGFVAERMF